MNVSRKSSNRIIPSASNLAQFVEFSLHRRIGICTEPRGAKSSKVRSGANRTPRATQGMPGFTNRSQISSPETSADTVSTGTRRMCVTLFVSVIIARSSCQRTCCSTRCCKKPMAACSPCSQVEVEHPFNNSFASRCSPFKSKRDASLAC